jgi:hypothetical protein
MELENIAGFTWNCYAPDCPKGLVLFIKTEKMLQALWLAECQ